MSSDRNPGSRDAGDDPVQRLLAEEILPQLVDPSPEAIAALLRALPERYPAHAARLTERIHALVDAGFLGRTWIGEPDPGDDPAPRRRFGDYQLLAQIGRGGQGRVYRARDTRLPRLVALKLVAGATGSSPRQRERFDREGQALSKLQHPGLCTVYEVGEVDGTPFIAMQLVEGQPLSQRIDATRDSGSAPVVALGDVATTGTGGSSPASRDGDSTALQRRDGVLRAVRLIEKTARALHAAHTAGVIHRDVKPGNIMVTPGGEPVLVDFGLARHDAGSSLTQTGDVLGTPSYMAPEQVEGRPASAFSDQYSLAVTLYECLTLRCPFDAPTRAALFRAITTQAAPDPRTFNPAVPRDVAVVLETALAPDREHRYRSLADFADDLRAVLEARPIAARPVSAFGRAVSWARREPTVAGLLATAAVALLGAAALGGYLAARWDDLTAGRDARRDAAVMRWVDEGFRHYNGYGDRARARDAFRGALRLDGSRLDAIAGLLLTELSADRAAAALAVLDEFAAVLAPHASYEAFRAQALRALGQETEATAVEAQLPAPRTATDLAIAGMVLNDRSHPRDAASGHRATALLQDALFRTRDPQPMLFTELATAARRAGDTALARRTTDAMLELWPELPSALLYTGLVHAQLDPDRAIAALQRYLDQSPGDAKALLLLSTAHKSKRDFAGAVAILEQALALDDDDPLTLNNLALALAHDGELDQAIAHMNRAIEVDPSFAGSFANLGSLLLERDLEAAEAAYRRALQIEPTMVVPRRNLARLLMQQRRWTDAAAVLAPAVELVPTDEETHKMYSSALRRAKDRAGYEAERARWAAVREK